MAAGRLVACVMNTRRSAPGRPLRLVRAAAKRFHRGRADGENLRFAPEPGAQDQIAEHSSEHRNAIRQRNFGFERTVLRGPRVIRAMRPDDAVLQFDHRQAKLLRGGDFGEPPGTIGYDERLQMQARRKPPEQPALGFEQAERQQHLAPARRPGRAACPTLGNRSFRCSSRAPQARTGHQHDRKLLGGRMIGSKIDRQRHWQRWAGAPDGQGCSSASTRLRQSLAGKQIAEDEILRAPIRQAGGRAAGKSCPPLRRAAAPECGDIARTRPTGRASSAAAALSSLLASETFPLRIRCVARLHEMPKRAASWRSARHASARSAAP